MKFLVLDRSHLCLLVRLLYNSLRGYQFQIENINNCWYETKRNVEKRPNPLFSQWCNLTYRIIFFDLWISQTYIYIYLFHLDIDNACYLSRIIIENFSVNIGVSHLHKKKISKNILLCWSGFFSFYRALLACLYILSLFQYSIPNVWEP